jgi:hypothetical protein
MPGTFELQRAERYRRLADSEPDGMKAGVLLRLAAEAEIGVLRSAERNNHIRVVHPNARVESSGWTAWRR